MILGWRGGRRGGRTEVAAPPDADPLTKEQRGEEGSGGWNAEKKRCERAEKRGGEGEGGGKKRGGEAS